MSVCTGTDGAAQLSSRRQTTVLLCGVSESRGHFKVTFVLGRLFFNQQATYAAGKGSATAVFQVYPPPPSTNYTQTSSGSRHQCQGSITAWILQQYSRVTGRLPRAEHDF